MQPLALAFKDQGAGIVFIEDWETFDLTRLKPL